MSGTTWGGGSNPSKAEKKPFYSTCNPYFKRSELRWAAVKRHFIGKQKLGNGNEWNKYKGQYRKTRKNSLKKKPFIGGGHKKGL